MHSDDAPCPAPDPCPHPNGKKLVRILVADDNPVNRQLTATLLASAGYSSDIVTNGHAAVAKYTADHTNYDLILMDVRMPEMDGLEATREIRRWEGCRRDSEKGVQPEKRVPIIAMTGLEGHGERARCMAAGMDGVFNKPIPWAALFQRIDEVLGA